MNRWVYQQNYSKDNVEKREDREQACVTDDQPEKTAKSWDNLLRVIKRATAKALIFR